MNRNSNAACGFQYICRILVALLMVALTATSFCDETSKLETVDLLIVAGQSNAVGYDARPDQLPVSDIDQQILFWWKCGDPPPDDHDSEHRSWTHLQAQPLGNPQKPRTGRQYGNFAQPEGGFGPEISLARTIYRKQSKRLAVLKVAFSGTGMRTDWNHADEGPGGACYRALLAEYRDCAAAAAKTNIRLRPLGFFWVQGESDANANDSPKYAAALGAMLGQFRKDVNVPALPAFVAVNTRFHEGRNRFMPVIVEQQKKLAAQDDQCWYVDTSQASIANDVHFDAAGTLEVGRLFAESWLQANQSPE